MLQNFVRLMTEAKGPLALCDHSPHLWNLRKNCPPRLAQHPLQRPELNDGELCGVCVCVNVCVFVNDMWVVSGHPSYV